MRFGIPEKSMDMIIQALTSFKEIQKAAIFGSRAIGNYKKGSDVDLVIYGTDITDEIVNSLRVRLNEELPLPYYFDVVHYETLSSNALKEHIDKLSKIFYHKTSRRLPLLQGEDV